MKSLKPALNVFVDIAKQITLKKSECCGLEIHCEAGCIYGELTEYISGNTLSCYVSNRDTDIVLDIKKDIGCVTLMDYENNEVLVDDFIKSYTLAAEMVANVVINNIPEFPESTKVNSNVASGQLAPFNTATYVEVDVHYPDDRFEGNRVAALVESMKQLAALPELDITEVVGYDEVKQKNLL